MNPNFILNGIDIADRVQYSCMRSPKMNTTELGYLLGSSRPISPQGKRKRYALFLRHLREEHMIHELRICAEYLNVDLPYLLFGNSFLFARQTL